MPNKVLKNVFITLWIGWGILFFFTHLLTWAKDIQKKSLPKKKVYIVPVEDEINGGTAYFIQRTASVIKENDVDLVIYKIDTPGGRVDYTKIICDTIESLKPIPTVAYVKQWAGSAGALISVTCSRIYMRKTAIMGAAEPIFSGSDATPQTAGEKFVSFLRTEIGARAQANGYPHYLAQAMVDKDLEIYEVVVNNKRDYLPMNEIDALWQDNVKVEIKRKVIEKGKLLTISAEQAVDYGFCKKIVKDENEIIKNFGLKMEEIEKITMNTLWSEKMVLFLTSSGVSVILLMIGMMALYIELSSPGIGFPGIIAGICFLLVFFGYYLAGLAQYTELILFLLGIMFILIEIFLIPGFGIVGIGGILCVVMSMLLWMQGFNLPYYRFQWDMFLDNILKILIAISCSLIGIVIYLKFLPRTPYLGKLVLQTQQDKSEGYIFQQTHNVDIKIGDIGVSHTRLRPSGKVLFKNNQLIDVVTDGEFIDSGDKVRVTNLEGHRVVVERILSEDSTKNGVEK